MADSLQDSFDSVLCGSDSRLVQSGLKAKDCKDDCIMFINAGGDEIQVQDPHLTLREDYCFVGGDVIGTDETIIEGGDYPSLYQSARFGNFSYMFDGLSAGDYFVDLHFAEIVNTNGPKGIRVFDVFVQNEKVLSDFDIYTIVGANKPLQLVDVRVSMEVGGAIIIGFEGKRGMPTVSGICIRQAPRATASTVNPEHVMRNTCAAAIEVSAIQNGGRTMEIIAKFEKILPDLINQLKLKSDQCYRAWLSLSAANDELQKLKMDHDTLEQIIEQQTDKLRHYERDKKLWAAALSNLEGKIKIMKQEQCQLSQRAHECSDSMPNMNMMIDGVQALVARCEDLKMKYSGELAKRKRLYNEVQELKGNIRVFCRCRPLSREEVASGYTTVVDFEAAKDGDLGITTGGSSKKTFKFDRVFTPRDNQADVYAEASPLVTSVLDGYNVCIFAYGQTGTGKTFTMEGTEQNRGVNYRTLEELFNISGERKETFSYSISVSVLEVYNEQIRDLLATSPSSKKLEIRQASEGSHHVPGIVEAKVENTKEVWDVLQAGSNARAVGSKNVNEHSSRSHCMLCIMVRAKNLVNGECTNSKLWLVDLAGSERLSKTDVQGERLKETQNINRSLWALGDVIFALATKSSHTPYRNSKLTHLLQDSLGGDSKALMFVQVSPSENDLGETLSSLNFASRVRGVELGPARKQIDTGELQKTKQMLDKVRQELRIKDESLRKLEENFQILENKVRVKEQCKNLQEKNKELEGQLESKVQLQSATKKQHWQLSEKLKGKEEACLALQQKVRELECRLKDRMHSESVAAQRVKELEFKLIREREQFESILEQKVKELEQRQREQPADFMLSVNSIEALGNATPTNGQAFSKDEFTSEMDAQILRSSNSINRQAVAHSSVLLKGRKSLHEIKRKRDAESSYGLPATSLKKKKMLSSSESDRTRKIDPAKAFGRLTRGSKGVATQKVDPYGRTRRSSKVEKEEEKNRS